MLPVSGSAAVAVGTADRWEAHRFDPSARADDSLGMHRLCGERHATLVRGARPVPSGDGGWLVVAGEQGTAAVRLGPDGVTARASLPDGARVLCAAGERLYVAVADELRSVPISRPRGE